MTEIRPLNEDPSSVQAHLTIMQSVIQRMAENSRSCKVWCVTLVAATLLLVARTGEPPHALIALVPTLLSRASTKHTSGAEQKCTTREVIGQRKCPRQLFGRSVTEAGSQQAGRVSEDGFWHDLWVV